MPVETLLVDAAVAVVAPVIVAALVNGNDIVDVIDAVDDQGSSFVTSRCAAHSISEPRAIV